MLHEVYRFCKWIIDVSEDVERITAPASIAK